MDRSTFEREVLHGPPVIFTGVVSSWPASSKWSFQWLGEQFGDRPVRIGNRNGNHPKPAVLRDFVARVESNAASDSYLANTELARVIPELAHDVSFPELRPIKPLSKADFWIGPAGTIANAHQDRPHNLNAQVLGRKRWTLSAPQRRYPEARTTWFSNFHAADLAPDRLASTEPPADYVADYDFVLEPGELLFLPSNWWHRVVALEPSISISLWWFDLKLVATYLPLALKDAPRALRVLLQRFGQKRARV